MLSRRSESSRVGLFATDQALLAGAFAGALVAHGALRGRPPAASLDGTLWLYVVTAPLAAVSLAGAGLYRISAERADPSIGRAWDVLWGGLLSMASLLAADLLLERLGARLAVPPVERGTAFLFAGASGAALLLSRTLVSAASRRLLGASEAGARVIVLGHSARVLRLLASFQRAPHLGLKVVGMVARTVPADVAPRMTMPQALALLEQGRVDHVVIETTDVAPRDLDTVMALADREGVSVHITSPIFPQTKLIPTWERVGGVPVLGFVAAELPLGARLAKRSFDLVVASVLLVLLAPPMALLGVLVRLTSRGPAFFVQERVGQGGHTFPMFKFRSMRIDAENETGPVWAVDKDPRCTRLGRWMRKTNLDELPQLINVVMGHMSLVGPRPERPEFVKGFKRKIPRYAHKHWVKPGITGWAQVHGLRGNTSLTERVEHDLYYIENWSLLLDLRILIRTAFHQYLHAA